MTKIDQLGGPALVRAYNDLAEIRQIKQVTRFSDRKAGALRVEASLEIVAETHDVTIAEDGAVTATLRGQTSSTAGQSAETTGPLSQPTAERRVSPGLARLEQNLGAEGAQALRDQVTGDSAAALAEAAERTDGPAAETTPALPTIQMPPGKTAPTDRLGLEKLLSKTIDGGQREAIKAAIAALPAAPASKPRDAAPPPRASTGRPPAVSDTDVILVKLTSDKNPKRAVAADRFGKYKHMMTVAEYTTAITPLCGNSADTAKKQALRDIAWDMKQGWIEIVGARAAADLAAAAVPKPEAKTDTAES